MRYPITGNHPENRCSNLGSTESSCWGRTLVQVLYLGVDSRKPPERLRKVQWKWEKSKTGALMSWPLGERAQSCRGPSEDAYTMHISIIPWRDMEVRHLPNNFLPLFVNVTSGGIKALMPWHFWADLSRQRKTLDTEHEISAPMLQVNWGEIRGYKNRHHVTAIGGSAYRQMQV